MSLMDKIKGWFSGGSSADEHGHDHDHDGHDHDHGSHEASMESAAMPPTDPTGMAEPSVMPGGTPLPAPPMTPGEPEARDDV